MQLHRGHGDRKILGDKLTGAGQRKVHRRGRICAEPGCGVFLSIYNGTDCCSLHHVGPGPGDSALKRRRSKAPDQVA